jgi:hypothetical protein
MEFKNCRRIVIVGNGGGSIDSKNGKFIDDSDIVLRIKKFSTEGFEEYVGSKTNIWFTKWFSYKKTTIPIIWVPFIDPYINIKDNNIKLINDSLFINQFDDRIINYDKHNSYIKEIGTNNINFLTEKELICCLNELNINYEPIYTKSGPNVFHPTTYLLSIFLCLIRYPEYKIYITGCDGFGKGYYWNLNETKKITKTWPHQYEKENLYIKKMIYTNKINLMV